ncbi:2TM domain-containing protein [Spongisporangium articulatum]|uniref:2TM domain-containing protein n=1 Tax=Spongisporangium articulatum TaxID=3362603 RepID=A0ABW8ANR9_9ACTN
MAAPYGTPEESAGDDLRGRALQRLKRKQAFYRQLTTYLIVNAFLWVIWVISGLNGGSWFPWPIFPLLGWGLGLAFQARSVFGRDGFTEAEIQAEMRRLSGD